MPFHMNLAEVKLKRSNKSAKLPRSADTSGAYICSTWVGLALIQSKLNAIEGRYENFIGIMKFNLIFDMQMGNRIKLTVRNALTVCELMFELFEKFKMEFSHLRKFYWIAGLRFTVKFPIYYGITHTAKEISISIFHHLHKDLPPQYSMNVLVSTDIPLYSVIYKENIQIE